MKEVPSCLTVIPARAGSKGLPGKNIRPLCGLPLLVHSLRCAELSSRPLRVIVSTDSEEIAAVARQAGGDVPFLRPAELAQDRTPTMPVLLHALDEMERREGRAYESLLLLEPTSPGRLPEDIDLAFQLLDGDPSLDGVIAVSRPSFNPFYVGVVERQGVLAPAFEGAGDWERRQDVPPFLRINGALYLWRTRFIRKAPPHWLKGKHRPLEIPESRAFSIDDQFEFDVAELFLRNGLVRLPWLS